MDTSKETLITVLDPRAQPDVAETLAPRLGSIRGATIGLLWNNRPRGDLVLRGLAEQLERVYGARTVLTSKLRVGSGAPIDQIKRLEKEVEAVIAGVGD